MTERLTFLEWDSEFFGFPVARIEGSTLTPEEARELTRQADAEAVRCIYFLAAADSPGSWRAAYDAGFEPIDIRVELAAEGPFPDVPRTLASIRDAGELLQVVREGVFGQSRFFRDSRFPRQKAQEMFEIWLRRGLEEPEWFTVREDQGFVACNPGSIQLVAVSGRAQGRGLGQKLIAAALAELGARGATRATVATQGGNIPAQRAYVNCGFRPLKSGLWFHRWHPR